jgi:hypothetical protein
MPDFIRSMKLTRPLPALAAALLALTGCGSSSKHPAGTGTTAPPASTSTSAASPPPPELAAAERPTTSGFPAVHGQSLRAVAGVARTQAQLGAATGTYTPGTRRIAFGLNDSSGAFVYGPTVLYIARTPSAPAQGPFPAPADPVTVAPQFRSQQNAAPGGLLAIYETSVPLPAPGTYAILALTRTPAGIVASPGEVAVAKSNPIPDVGQRPPDIATDTPASVHGDTALLTTRVPTDDMHSVSFNQVLGKRPVALLFSTPQLCQSRVCGPVTDILVELEQQYRDRIAFIHEEVYVDNNPSKGLRPQLKAFGLETEPWLFTVNRRGVIAARLEGAFGVNAVRNALEAALR